jgi:triosephosphate isomerase
MRTIVAGNWKMHKDKAEALALLNELVKANAGQPAVVEVIV